MIPMYHPWTDWQIDFINSNAEWDWKWKKDTPEEIKKQYKEWIDYYNSKMKLKYE